MTLWDVFVWMLCFYVVVTCLIIFITAVLDVFRDHTLNGWAKAFWVLFMFVLPILGVLVYLIVRAPAMRRRHEDSAPV